jgi:hypothetical protein
MVKHILKTRLINGSKYALLPIHVCEMEDITDDKLIMVSIEKVPCNDSE